MPVTRPGSGWWMYQANPLRTAFRPGTGVSVPLVKKWQKDLTSLNLRFGVCAGSPVFGKGRVLYPLSERLFALATRDGSVLWSFSPPENEIQRPAERGTPAVANGVVYAWFSRRGVTPEADRIYALDQRDGTVIWSSPLPSERRWCDNIAVAWQRIFVQGEGPSLLALDQASGTVAWTRELAQTARGGPYGSPAVGWNKVVVAGWDAAYAVDAIHNVEIWRYDFERELTVYSPAIYVPAGRPDLKRSVVVVAGTPPSYSPVPPRRTIIVYGLRLDLGVQIWRFSANLGEMSDPVPHCHSVVAGDKVLVLAGKKIFALDAPTGNFLWDYTAPEELPHPAACSNGILYFRGFSSMTVYGVNIENHELAWTADLPATMANDGGIAVDQGLVVVPSSDFVTAFAAPPPHIRGGPLPPPRPG